MIDARNRQDLTFPPLARQPGRQPAGAHAIHWP